jgi:hypothetical protein
MLPCAATMSNVLIILGMHRSGTSLLARYLTESGVFMGYRLLEQHATNPAGHYEDKDILSLHHDLLRANNHDHKIIKKVAWHIGPEFHRRGEQIVADRSQYAVWGWKDPRTCLFLDFWKSHVPDANYLICYRRYSEVITSLITRDITFYRELTSRLQRIRHPRYKSEEIYEMANTYLRVWIYYNSVLLAHMEDPEIRYTLTPFDEITVGSFNCLEKFRHTGILSRVPKRFVPNQSRSLKKLKLDFVLDPRYIAEADVIHSRFSRILQSLAH